MGMVGLDKESLALVEKRLEKGNNFVKQFCSYPDSPCVRKPGRAQSVLVSCVFSGVPSFENLWLDPFQILLKISAVALAFCWSINWENWAYSKNPSVTLTMKWPLPLHNSIIDTRSSHFPVLRNILLYGTDTYLNHRPVISVGSRKQILLLLFTNSVFFCFWFHT